MMSALIHKDHVEIFKFVETGALPMFDEVMEYIAAEHHFGRRWEVVDIYKKDGCFCARLEPL